MAGEDMSFYTVPPSDPPPPRPNAKPYSAIQRISAFKDMLILNAATAIEENIPHPPDLSKFTKHDEPDGLMLPKRIRALYGIEQEDFIAKAISAIAWFFFIVARMLSISAFAFFYLFPCFYVCILTYVIMVAFLLIHSKCRNIYRTYFYFFLGYVYIFVILEFKIKFVKIRYCYGAYVLFIVAQNLTMTLVWYLGAQYNSWWFKYMFSVIVGSTVLFVSCMSVYLLILKPKSKIIT